MVINQSLAQHEGRDSVGDCTLYGRLRPGNYPGGKKLAKTAIVFHSLHGNVRAVARKIAELTCADLIELVIPGADRYKGFMMYFRLGFMASTKRCPKIEGGDVDISGYDNLIIGSLVWASTFSPALRTFFRDHSISNQKVGAFFCHKGGLGRTPANLDAYLKLDGKLISVDEIEPDRHDKVDELARRTVEVMNLESK